MLQAVPALCLKNVGQLKAQNLTWHNWSCGRSIEIMTSGGPAFCSVNNIFIDYYYHQHRYVFYIVVFRRRAGNVPLGLACEPS